MAVEGAAAWAAAGCPTSIVVAAGAEAAVVAVAEEGEAVSDASTAAAEEVCVCIFLL